MPTGIRATYREMARGFSSAASAVRSRPRDHGSNHAPESVHPGDAAVLLGGDGPSATELAALAGTIPYEIFTRLGRRVRRIIHC